MSVLGHENKEYLRQLVIVVRGEAEQNKNSFLAKKICLKFDYKTISTTSPSLIQTKFIAINKLELNEGYISFTIINKMIEFTECETKAL